MITHYILVINVTVVATIIAISLMVTAVVIIIIYHRYKSSLSDTNHVALTTDVTTTVHVII